jgi:choline dehydrogenase-like flavoprotein
LAALARSGPRLASIAARAAAGRLSFSRFVVIDQMEQEPDPASRIRVNHREKDRFGLPRLELDWRIGDSTYRSMQRMHTFFRDILHRAGIRAFRSQLLARPDVRPTLWDMKHPTGTTRMATLPTAGVVDEDCRVHGVENLFIAGSSVFPTSGHANPTLLLVALAARLAHHIRARLGRE